MGEPMRKHTGLPSEERPEGRAIRIGQIPLFLRSLFPLALVDAIIHLSSPQHATITNTRFLFHSFPAADVSARVKHSRTHTGALSHYLFVIASHEMEKGMPEREKLMRTEEDSGDHF